MPRRYFDKFPVINYNGHNVRDVTVAAKLMNKYANLPYVYTPYEVEFGRRADQVSDQQYGDPYMTWLLYYANKSMDPYYDWFLDERNFNSHLYKKYGSIPYTFKKIVGFRTNWFQDSRELSPDSYFAMFGEYKAPHSFYWNPVYDPDTGRIMYYVRKEFDRFVNTNKMVKVIVAGGNLQTGDLVDIKLSGTIVGTAEVAKVQGTSIFLKNVLGEIGSGHILAADGRSPATIETYSANFDPTATTWTITNISEEEYIYWTPYTLHDVENEKNESKKFIKVVDGSTAFKIADRIEEELSGR